MKLDELRRRLTKGREPEPAPDVPREFKIDSRFAPSLTLGIDVKGADVVLHGLHILKNRDKTICGHRHNSGLICNREKHPDRMHRAPDPLSSDKEMAEWEQADGDLWGAISEYTPTPVLIKWWNDCFAKCGHRHDSGLICDREPHAITEAYPDWHSADHPNPNLKYDSITWEHNDSCLFRPGSDQFDDGDELEWTPGCFDKTKDGK